MLVDGSGVLMDLPAHHKYSFPVILGLSASEPAANRAASMKIYSDVMWQLDSSGRYSQDLSEVDLSDSEDVKVLTNDSDGEVLVHLGASNYLDRFKIYVAHLREWRQQFPKLESVDLRYERQIVVNPDLRSEAPMPHISPAAAKAAIAAGVKPATLLAHETVPAKAPHAAVTLKKPVEKPVQKQARKPVKQARPHAPGRVVARRLPAPSHKVRKPVATARHASPKPAVHNASLTTKAQTTPAQKPSPAIVRGEQGR
jgi:cell division protein FtsQ